MMWISQSLWGLLINGGNDDCFDVKLRKIIVGMWMKQLNENTTKTPSNLLK